MKKVQQITFEGFEFYIDEDARILFYEFIENNEKTFQQDPELKAEWEKFKTDLKNAIKEKITSEKKVMSITDLEQIINKLSPGYSSNTKQEPFQSTGKLFRNIDSSVIGGVCSGISEYIGIDVAWIRLLFIILIFTPIGIIGYIILWAVLPPNIIREDKTRSHKTKYQNKQEKAHHQRKKEKVYYYKEDRNNTPSVFFTGLGNLFRAIFQSIGFLLGLVFILIGIAILFKFLNIWPDSFHGFHYTWDDDWYDIFGDINQNKLLLLICIALLIVIPVISIIFGFIRTVFNMKKNRVFGYSMILIWFLCLLTTIGLLVSNEDMTNYSSSRVSSNLNPTSSNTFYIDMRDMNRMDYSMEDRNNDFLKYGYVKKYGDKILCGKPNVKITHSESSQINEIIIRKEARLNDNPKDRYNLYDIEYIWEQRDSLILLDKYFYSSSLHWWNFPEVSVEIIVPNEKNVFFTEPFHQEHYR